MYSHQTKYNQQVSNFSHSLQCIKNIVMAEKNNFRGKNPRQYDQFKLMKIKVEICDV